MPEVTINLTEEEVAIIDGVRGHFSRAQFAAGLIFCSIEMWIDEKEAEQHRLSKEFFGRVVRTRSRVAELAEERYNRRPAKLLAAAFRQCNCAPAKRLPEAASTGVGKSNGGGCDKRRT